MVAFNAPRIANGMALACKVRGGMAARQLGQLARHLSATLSATSCRSAAAARPGERALADSGSPACDDGELDVLFV